MILKFLMNLKQMNGGANVVYKHVLVAYDKDNEKLIKEIPLNDISLSELKAIFEVQSDDPEMVYDYCANEAHLSKLQCLRESDINTKKYDYFVMAYSLA